MKRKLTVLSVLIGLLCAGTSVGLAYAQSFRVATPAGHTVDGSVYSAGRAIDIEGTVNGDVFCSGQDIVVNATVHGDVLCFGQNILIEGHVDGNVRVVGLSVEVDAAISGSTSVAAETSLFDQSTHIGRDLTTFGSNTTINGTIGRDASLASKTTRLNATVGRNVVMSGTNLALQKNAHIVGDLSYTSANTISRAQTAKIDGAQHAHITPAGKQNHIALLGIFSLTLFPMLLVFSLLLVLLLPKFFQKTTEMARPKLFHTFLYGIASLFVIPLAGFLLTLSVIGSVAAIFLALVLIMLILLSGPVAAYYLGNLIAAKSKNAIIIMVAGTIILLVAYLIPLIGIVAAVFAYMIGAGAMLRYARHHFKKPSYKV